VATQRSLCLPVSRAPHPPAISRAPSGNPQPLAPCLVVRAAAKDSRDLSVARPGLVLRCAADTRRRSSGAVRPASLWGGDDRPEPSADGASLVLWDASDSLLLGGGPWTRGSIVGGGGEPRKPRATNGPPGPPSLPPSPPAPDPAAPIHLPTNLVVVVVVGAALQAEQAPRRRSATAAAVSSIIRGSDSSPSPPPPSSPPPSSPPPSSLPPSSPCSLPRPALPSRLQGRRHALWVGRRSPCSRRGVVDG
jgi:hypothetical protein